MLGGIAVMILAQIVGLSYGTIPEFWRYITSVVMMYAIGYPIGHTAVLGAFSKIQKSGKYFLLIYFLCYLSDYIFVYKFAFIHLFINLAIIIIFFYFRIYFRIHFRIYFTRI